MFNNKRLEELEKLVSELKRKEKILDLATDTLLDAVIALKDENEHIHKHLVENDTEIKNLKKELKNATSSKSKNA